eukprot:m.133612 g.133612  ORF g.133612 m.133612 type:complete len:148 (-) comp13843_c0_seq3:53-496(-)
MMTLAILFPYLQQSQPSDESLVYIDDFGDFDAVTDGDLCYAVLEQKYFGSTKIYAGLKVKSHDEGSLLSKGDDGKPRPLRYFTTPARVDSIEGGVRSMYIALGLVVLPSQKGIRKRIQTVLQKAGDSTANICVSPLSGLLPINSDGH